MKTERLDLMLAFIDTPGSPLYELIKSEIIILKHLAAIGEAVEKAFDKYYCTMLIVGKDDDEPSCSVQSVSELLDWAKGEIHN